MATNLSGVPSWNTNAVKFLTDSSVLGYREIEPGSCRANINLQNGTVRFWFKPDWGSPDAGGVGPQTDAKLIELGTKGSSDGWWAVGISPQGTNLVFGTQTNSTLTLTTNLSGPISWSPNTWHQIVVTYSIGNSSLYVDGEPVVTNGVGVAYYPGAAARAQGFFVGNSVAGLNEAKGACDELETFNYPIDATSIKSDFQSAISRDADGDGWPDILEEFLGSNPYGPGSVPAGFTINNPADGSVVHR